MACGTALFAEGPGTTRPGTAGRPIATGTSPTTGTTILASALPELGTRLDDQDLTRPFFPASRRSRCSRQNKMAAGVLVGGRTRATARRRFSNLGGGT